MAIKPNNKGEAIAEHGKPIGQDLLRAAILKIDSNGIVAGSNSINTFLLNPETYEESKKSNWIPSQIPGNSDPIWQYMSGGPRTISFEALVTKETSDFDVDKEQKKKKTEDTLTQVVNSFASIAGSLFGIDPVASPAPPPTLANVGSLDISDQLNYYRSLLYPTYDNDNKPSRLRSSPPLVALVVGNTFNKSKYGNKISSTSNVYIVTDIKIRITKQLSNLSPMEASVNFTLAQYNTRSFGQKHWSNI